MGLLYKLNSEVYECDQMYIIYTTNYLLFGSNLILLCSHIASYSSYWLHSMKILTISYKVFKFVIPINGLREDSIMCVIVIVSPSAL